MGRRGRSRCCLSWVLRAYRACSISGNYGLKNVRDRVCDHGVMNSDFEREGRAHFHRQRAGPRLTT